MEKFSKIFMWIGVVIVTSFLLLGMYGYVFEFVDKNSNNLFILDMFLTAFSFMIFPFARFFRKNNKYSNEQIKKELIINSIVVEVSYIIIKIILGYSNPVGSLYPPLLYYWINSLIWKNKNTINDINDYSNNSYNNMNIYDENIKSQKNKIEQHNIKNNETIQNEYIEDNYINKKKDNTDKVMLATIIVLILLALFITVVLIYN